MLRVCIALTLYGLLGVIVWSQWQDLKQVHRQHTNLPHAYLQMEEGQGSVNSFQLGAFNLVGRGVDNSIVLGDSSVSTHHGRVSFQGGQWWIEDLGSRNGTSLNDIEVIEPLVVTYGDKLRFGRIWMSLQAGRPPTPS